MINVDEAEKRLARSLVRFGSETVPLALANGRRLREPLIADRDYPPFNRVAMDGYALRFAAWKAGQRRFFVESTQTAGQAPQIVQDSEAAIEIMTGAKLPEGLDLVIRYEDTLRDGDFVTIAEDLRLEEYSNIHRQGIDAARGAAFVEGTIHAPFAAIAASFGCSELPVARKARVAVLGTGDELVAVDAKPLDYQIRESNIHAVAMALRSRGHQVEARILKDERHTIAEAVRDALDRYDILLLSGGVSAGKTDFVPQILEDAGVEKVFHRIAQKPGKPLWFGRNTAGKVVFGLPGNPVSTLVCLYRYVLPFLDGCEKGEASSFPGLYAELQGERPKNSKLTHFVPVRIEHTAQAKSFAHAIEHNGSGDFASLAGTDGFLEIPGQDEPDFDPAQTCFKYYSWT